MLASVCYTAIYMVRVGVKDGINTIIYSIRMVIKVLLLTACYKSCVAGMHMSRHMILRKLHYKSLH